MSTAAEVCPDSEVLRRFLAGEIGISAGNQVEVHVASCPNCQKVIESLESNGLVQSWIGTRSRVLSDSGVRNLADRLVPQLKKLWQFPIDTRSSLRESLGSMKTNALEATAETTHQPIATEVRQVQEGFVQAAEVAGRIDRFQLICELGRGGMGLVYLAEDPRLGRPVALKVIHDRRFLQPQHRTRFEREGLALARFSHPNIVQIYEVGQHAPEEKPFLALEYIAGGTLASYLAGRPQPTRDSAQYIATLARAIQYAHERGIIHRDLKPSNVLLEELETVPLAKSHTSNREFPLMDCRSLSAYRPKITDFGLAKHLDDQGLTESLDLLGTPGYMAPELASSGGAAVAGVSSDVYSLGAILYEMLTGRPPFRGETVLDTLNLVRSSNPVSPRRLRPTLPRDLETVCLKCLEQNPSRRYDTAAALADDLERYLRGDPIHARPTPWWERTRKWARRKPALAALVTISAASMLIFAVGVTIHTLQLRSAAIEARRLQERAESQYREARDAMSKMLASASARKRADLPKLQELRREQQEAALAFYLRIAEQPESARSDVRLDVAQACLEAGKLQMALGLRQEGRDNLERAARLFGELAAAVPDQTVYRFGQALSLNALGNWHGKDEQAGAQHRQARTLLEQLVQEDPVSVEFRDALAFSLTCLGNVAKEQKHLDEAERLYRQAEVVRTKLLQDQPNDAEIMAGLAQTYVNQSLLYQNLSGRREDAQQSHDRAREILEQLCKLDPYDFTSLISLTALRLNWAYMLASEGKSDSSLVDLGKNIEDLAAAMRHEPNHRTVRDQLFRAHGARAQILESLQRFDEELPDRKRVVELLDPGPDRDYQRLFLAQAYARTNDHANAFAEVEALAAKPPRPSSYYQQFYHLAGVCATAFAALQKDQNLPESERTAVSERYAAKTVALLATAQESAGPVEWKKLIPGLLDDELFKPFQSRTDFQRLVKD